MLLDFPRGASDKLLIKEQQKNDSNIALCSGRAGSLWWWGQEGAQGRAVPRPLPSRVLSGW